ncbi:MAG: hypothetical protein HY719_06825 [Planctomycetes bacterium]|nr:hypothetical protein [Planctomycetota bacterium]
MPAKDLFLFTLVVATLGVSAYAALAPRETAPDTDLARVAREVRDLRQQVAADLAELRAAPNAASSPAAPGAGAPVAGAGTDAAPATPPAQREEFSKEITALRAEVARLREISARAEAARSAEGAAAGQAGAAAAPGEATPPEEARAAMRGALKDAMKDLEREKVAAKVKEARRHALEEAAGQIQKLAAEMGLSPEEQASALQMVEKSFDAKAALKDEFADDPESEEFQARMKELDQQFHQGIESLLGPQRYEEAFISRSRGEWEKQDVRRAESIDQAFTRYGAQRGVSGAQLARTRTTVEEGMAHMTELERRRRPTRADPALEEEIQRTGAALESDLRAQLGDEGFEALRQEFKNAGGK